MAAKPSPTMLRRQLGAELRRQRERVGLTVAQLAKDLGWSESKLSRIETASSGVRNSDLERLFQLYGLSQPERERILALAGLARQRGWWEAYGDSLADAYETYIGFEAEASCIYTYEPQAVPGLLQTAEYARAVAQAIAEQDRPEVVEQLVAVRLARQAVLSRDPGPKLWAVLDEAAFRRTVGGPEVMRRQLLRLVEASSRPTVTLQMLPFNVGAHRGMSSSFVVLEFPGNEDSLVYSEGMTGGVFRSKPAELRTYWMSFEALRAAALSHADTTRFIADLADALEPNKTPSSKRKR